MGFFSRKPQSVDITLAPAMRAWLTAWMAQPGLPEKMARRVLHEVERHERTADRMDVGTAEFRAVLGEFALEVGNLRREIEDLRAVTMADGAACKALSARLTALEVSRYPEARKCTCPPGGVSVWQQGGKCNHCLGIG